MAHQDSDGMRMLILSVPSYELEIEKHMRMGVGFGDDRRFGRGVSS